MHVCEFQKLFIFLHTVEIVCFFYFFICVCVCKYSAHSVRCAADNSKSEPLAFRKIQNKYTLLRVTSGDHTQAAACDLKNECLMFLWKKLEPNTYMYLYHLCLMQPEYRPCEDLVRIRSAACRTDRPLVMNAIDRSSHLISAGPWPRRFDG